MWIQSKRDALPRTPRWRKGYIKSSGKDGSTDGFVILLDNVFGRCHCTEHWKPVHDADVHCKGPERNHAVAQESRR